VSRNGGDMVDSNGIRPGAIGGKYMYGFWWRPNSLPAQSLSLIPAWAGTLAFLALLNLNIGTDFNNAAEWKEDVQVGALGIESERL
jgi:hypothetical protein